MTDIPANIKNAVRDLHWMARRYADGRCSYAPGMFNGRVRDLLASGFELGQPLFARDGMGRAFDGLTEDEVSGAEEDMPHMHTKVIDVGEERLNEVWDKAVEACISEIKNQIETFSSEEYATDQPHSSFGERFACKSCIEALEEMKGGSDGWGHNHPMIEGEVVDCEAWALRSLKRSDKENGQ